MLSKNVFSFEKMSWLLKGALKSHGVEYTGTVCSLDEGQITILQKIPKGAVSDIQGIAQIWADLGVPWKVMIATFDNRGLEETKGMYFCNEKYFFPKAQIKNRLVKHNEKMSLDVLLDIFKQFASKKEYRGIDLSSEENLI